MGVIPTPRVTEILTDGSYGGSVTSPHWGMLCLRFSFFHVELAMHHEKSTIAHPEEML